MVSKVYMISIIISILACYTASDFTTDYLIKCVIKYIKDRPKFRLITMYSKTPDKLSSTSMLIMKKISNEFPTLAVSIKELSNAQNISCDNRLSRMKKWLYSRSQRKSFQILVIDNTETCDSNLEQILIDRMSFIVNSSLKTIRPRFIAFVINARESANLREFFKFSWTHQFLDIIVIEILNPITRKCLLPDSSDNATIIMHQYNPFNDTYHVENFLDRAKARRLFVDKLYNMHGYKIHTGMFDNIPMVMIQREYNGTEPWGMAQGLDVTITRELAKSLNFNASVKVVNSDNPNLLRFNITNDYLGTALENGNIDFAVNFNGMVISKPLEDMTFETSIFLYPFSSNLIVKQHGEPVMKISRNILVVVFVIIFTIIIFYIFSRLFRLDAKYWTTYNMIQILVGSSIRKNYRKPLERVLFMSLTIVSCALSVNILEQLLEIYLWQQTFAEMKTLQDVLNAGIVPAIIKNTKKNASYFNNTALQKILQNSKTIQKEELVPDCIDSLINRDNISACEVDSILGKLVAQSFPVAKERTWIISLVEEPIIQPCWTAMMVKKTTPYIDRFNWILRRFLEAGLVRYWFDDSLRNFTRIYKNFFGDNVKIHHDYQNMLNQDLVVGSQNISLDLKIFLFLLLGHGISFFIFIIELSLGYYKRSKRNKRIR